MMGSMESLRTDRTAGIILALATIIALGWATLANDSYESVRGFALGPHALHLHLDLATWAQDALLALFFFVVGLELKREVVLGALSDRRAAALPVLAALGGVAVPAAIAALITHDVAGAGRAWSIPMATDVAFALGVLALVGVTFPSSGRTLLLSLAVVDDLVAIVLIAALFTSGIGGLALAATALCVVAYWLLQRARVTSPVVYVPLAIATWALLHGSGVHATLAGVALGLATRVHRDPGEPQSPAERLEHRLQPWSACVAVPLYALFAAGVPLSLPALRALADDRIAWAIVIGLVVGKLIGITGAAALAVRTGVARRPDDLAWSGVATVGLLGGIGFTVSLLLADLALDGAAAERAKLAVLVGSLLATALASIALRMNRAGRR